LFRLFYLLGNYFFCQKLPTLIYTDPIPKH
jgi:hypothetical protein